MHYANVLRPVRVGAPLGSRVVDTIRRLFARRRAVAFARPDGADDADDRGDPAAPVSIQALAEGRRWNVHT